MPLTKFFGMGSSSSSLGRHDRDPEEMETERERKRADKLEKKLNSEIKALRARLVNAENAHNNDLHRISDCLRQAGLQPAPQANPAAMIVDHCRRLQHDNEQLHNQFSRLRNDYEQSQSQLQACDADLRAERDRAAMLESDLNQRERELKGLKNELVGQRQMHVQEMNMQIQKMNEAARQHEAKKAEMQHNFNQQMGRLHADHRDELSTKESMHLALIQSLEDKHEAEVRALKAEINDFSAALLSQTDEFRPATDQTLKQKFDELKKRVSNVTLPHNLSLPSGAQLPTDLDPTGFLARQGPANMQYILSSVVWEVLLDGFFASPLGFGCLGPEGDGAAALLDIHRSWLALFGGASHGASYQDGAQELEVYGRDLTANKWRSALFLSFLPAVMPNKSGAKQQQQQPQQPGYSSVAAFYRENCRRVEGQLVELLSSATGSHLRPDIRDFVPELVHLAAELAFEFGVQRAQVCISAPARGETVRIGTEFHDCQDGALARGQEFAVDLVVHPGLFRVGDGRKDLKARKVLLPCEIYPTQCM